MKQLIEKVNNSLVGGLTVVLLATLSLFLWRYEYNTPISLFYVCIIAISCYILCILIYAICSVARVQHVSYKLPEVKNVIIKDGAAIFLTENIELFSVQSVVSVYIQDADDVEMLAGLGYVETRNEKNFLQIRLIKNMLNENINFFSEFKNNAKKLDTIKIKPTVPKEFLKGDMYDE